MRRLPNLNSPNACRQGQGKAPRCKGGGWAFLLIVAVLVVPWGFACERSASSNRRTARFALEV